MKLKELLDVYNSFGGVVLKDMNNNLIDIGKNGNLIKNLFGEREVHKFWATSNDEIKVKLKDQEV